MSEQNKRGSRVLRFAVSGALLVAPLAVGCEEEPPTINVMPEPTINEPAEPEAINNPPEPVQPTVNEPADPPGPQVPEEPAAPSAEGE